jgi:hypothetical protein
MIKNITKLEHTIGTRTYQFLCEGDSPTSDVKEVLLRLIKWVVDIEDAARAQADAVQVTEPQPDVKNEQCSDCNV